MSEQPTRVKIFVESITIGHPNQVSGKLAENFRPVQAVVDDDEAARLRMELATQSQGMGSEPPSTTVPMQAIKWLGELG
jgi:hypothetical protein